jgi:uncharacterized protein (TIGR02444 family)
MDWPVNPFWDYSIELYGLPGVEAACLELQRRHDLDVNLVLLCCWAAVRGVELDRLVLSRARSALAAWQAEVVRPLRAVRRRLKAELTARDPDSIAELWPGLTAAIRERALGLEIAGEHLAQLWLARLVGPLPASARPEVALAGANLSRFWPFDRGDRAALQTLLGAAFPEAGADDLDAALGWIAT